MMLKAIVSFVVIAVVNANDERCERIKGRLQGVAYDCANDCTGVPGAGLVGAAEVRHVGGDNMLVSTLTFK